MHTTFRDEVREAADHWKQQARTAAAEKAAQGRAAVYAWARNWWTETAKHRPTAFAALGLIVAGLSAAANGYRLAVLAGGCLLATFGAVVTYLVAYRIQYMLEKRHGDVEDYNGRRPGRNARHVARQCGAATSLYGLWLLLVVLLGVSAASWPAAVALEVELLTGALLAWIACRGHWAHLWEQRRRLTVELPALRAEPVTADEEVREALVSDETPGAEIIAVDADSDDRSDDVQGVLDAFNINGTVVGYTRGPVVSRYELELGRGVSVDTVLKRQKDFAKTFGTEQVRLYVPIPGKPRVGVEVPNARRDLVTFDEVIKSPAMRDDPHPLLVGLGKDVEGNYVVANLASFPHILIAGATGAGKSVCLNTLLHSLLTRAAPDQVRLLLVDPKRVELTPYDGIPHLVAPVVTDPGKASDALQWVIGEMDRRYDLFVGVHAKNIDSYNEKAAAAGLERLWYLVVIIDEIADLTMVAKAMLAADKHAGVEIDPNANFEQQVVRITQLARAAGIHLVLATQSPRVDVVTGLIKANVPSRLAFATSNGTDSRVILDQNGAERLVGRGDGLFLPMGASSPVRFQCAWTSEEDVEALVEALKAQPGPGHVADFSGRQVSRRPVDRPSPPQAPDVVLAIAFTEPGCSSARIAAHPAWEAAGLKPPTQPTLSRVTGVLVDEALVSRVKDGRSWSDYRVTDAGRARAETAATTLRLTALDDAA
jgi:hypothetical protein